MAHVHPIDSQIALAQATVIRDRESALEELHDALYVLGTEVARAISQQFFVRDESVTTPLNVSVSGPIVRYPPSVVVTTREDLENFATGLSSVIRNTNLGWMNFEGRRGLEALNSPIRSSDLPDMKGRAVDSLIIAKAVLATGCTALSLTRSAFGRYMPNRLIIASVFYTDAGLDLLDSEFPNAHVFVVGHPDNVTDDGVMTPGIGMLSERLGGHNAV